MCLRLYLGGGDPPPLQSSPDLGVAPVDPTATGVARWFSQPSIQLVTSGSTCSCGFPSVLSETPVEHFHGLWPHDRDRTNELRTVHALLELLRAALAPGGAVELYPVWNGDESLPPKGVIPWALAELEPDTFVFNERFMHVVSAGAAAV